MNLLEVNNICKIYGSGETAVHALKKVSFSVPKGEYVAIVGESGSGKSTLLNMIGALDTPTSGKVTIGGKDIFSMNDSRLTVFRPDTQNSREVIALLKEASRKYEQTIIMITHSRSNAQSADRILQVSDGILTDLG